MGAVIAEETKIRVVAAVWFSGCVNTISFNCVPQLTVSEVVGDLPCSDALFEALTADSFAERRGNANCAVGQGLSLEKWLAMYLRDDWPGHDSPVFAALDPKLLTLHVVALHSARTSLLSQPTYPTLFRATTCWKELYEAIYARTNTSAQAQPVGFVKYSLELWWLARKLLELVHAGEKRSGYLAGAPTDSLQDLREFVRRYGW